MAVRGAVRGVNHTVRSHVGDGGEGKISSDRGECMYVWSLLWVVSRSLYVVIYCADCLIGLCAVKLAS